MTDIAVIGGGLAGLVSSILLRRHGLDVVLVERNLYPFHKVCGEYVSNEVKPFLKKHDLFPSKFNPPDINRFQLTSVSGKRAFLSLKQGGFGISRFSLDHFLLQKAIASGVEVRQDCEVEDVSFVDDYFDIKLAGNSRVSAKTALGSFGKRSKLDRKMQRRFMSKNSPFLGVKYHARFDIPPDEIALHNFRGGYCGISRIEDGKVNICYLSKRENLARMGSIEALEQKILSLNPHLKTIFREAEFLFEKPLVINEISFETKEPVFNHILMIGDAAGMITPLCGNGMAIAIHSAKLASESLIRYFEGTLKGRIELEKNYHELWRENFSKRLWAGRKIQKLFGGFLGSNLAVQIAGGTKPLANYLINQTHGKPF